MRDAKTLEPKTLDTAQLSETLKRLHKARATDAFRVRRDWFWHADLETRRPADGYFWDGEKRGGERDHPYFTWQYTLAGRGVFEEGGQRHEMTPGTAFVATVPSAHRYFLPGDSASWTFFWFTFRHDYLAKRLREGLSHNGGFVHAEPSSRLVTRAVALFEMAAQSRSDAFAEEGALFDFALELERFWHHAAFAHDERAQWLEDAKNHVLHHLQRAVTVDELASLRGMSRSHYTHRFKAATGRSPAQWIQQVRLEEATRRLVRTDQKLDGVARATGLQNANHLCKVFRRHFHLSPGEFRRQMR